MSKIAFVYPGQGAQKKDMGKDFFEAGIAFDVASEYLGIDIKNEIITGSDRLNQTRYTQAAILAVEIAITDEIIKLGIKPDMTAGLSLGEYAAIYAAGGIELGDALKVTAERGRLMEEAVPSGVGAMTAVLGLTKEEVDEAISNIDDIWIANYNTNTQIIITGKKEKMKEAILELKAKGSKICKELNVSGPFHSPLLDRAGFLLKDSLDEINFKQLRIPYVSNVTAEPVFNKEEISRLLMLQVSNSVKWEQSVQFMISQGVDTFIEIGPSKTLTNMIKKIKKDVLLINVETKEDLKDLRGKINV
jgi:[acyl-carrier-protein] S-malonyltransferase